MYDKSSKVPRAAFTRPAAAPPPHIKRCFGHDYRAPGFYMITVSTHGRRPRFGTCTDNACHLSDDGRLVRDRWRAIPRDYPEITTSTLCMMPDHLHGILRVTAPMAEPLGVALRAFKSRCTSALRQRHGDPGLVLWEPGYNDLCVQGRLLIVSSPAFAALMDGGALTRAACLAMNEAAAAIATHSLSPGAATHGASAP